MPAKGGYQRRTRKIVNYSWAGFVQPARVIIPPATKALLGFFVLDTAFEETIVRVRGELTVVSDQAVALEDQVGAFGMIRVTDRALAAGAASIPGPVTDSDDDGWFVWVPIAQVGALTVQAGSIPPYVIDSKAQRIIREGQSIAVMIENASAAHGLQVLLSFRALARFRS